MSQGWVGIIERLISPPGGLLLLLVIGLYLLKTQRVVGYRILVFATGLFYLLSLPITALGLAALLETASVLDVATIQKENTAIVVLGGGRREQAAEFAGDTLSRISLERVRYGAWLAKQSGLPILVSGGLAKGEKHPAEAQLMKQAIEGEFQGNVRWLEPGSSNTYENARNSSAILRDAGVDHIYLVTHAWHMPRSLWSFKQFGITVTPAPTVFTESQYDSGIDWVLPNPKALEKVAMVCHEIFGLVWYRLRY